MILIDFICSDCEEIFEVDKGTTSAPTPKNVKCPKCTSTNTTRLFAGRPPATDVAEGKFGNAANGYSQGITEHRSSKYGVYKGKRI